MRLIKFSKIHKNQFLEYIADWESTDEKIVPSMVKANGSTETFEDLMARWEQFNNENTVPINMVAATLYFLVDDENKIIGAIDFRWKLNDFLLKYGGNIGYGIRPSKRRKGYGIIILKRLIEEIRDREIDRVLITCYEDNIGSARIIEACDGVLENVVDEDGKTKKRYWINL